MLSANLSAIFYLISGVLFILALRGLSSPETSRQGNFFGILGMVIAVTVTFFIDREFFEWFYLCFNISFNWWSDWCIYSI
ncbi:NAD(P)(+) transhydrogenase (Re/Si-specific) subunit beta [Candidatus Pelagibacter sp.]|nr:NAD(P)(+) transhydrogenase (Re/Si-specific) subunit beta [Candidatus Pelagibacter sp.]